MTTGIKHCQYICTNYSHKFKQNRLSFSSWGESTRGETTRGAKRPGAKRPGAKRRWGETSRGRTGSGAKRPGFLTFTYFNYMGTNINLLQLHGY